MENASKAMIIAGAILISIMIISLAVLIFNNFSDDAKQMANLDEEEISAFNSKITPYLGNSVAGSQVNALLQYCITNNIAATQSNETYKYITATYPTATGSTETIDGNSDSYTKVQTGGKYYTVTASYDTNGLATTITITQN